MPQGSTDCVSQLLGGRGRGSLGVGTSLVCSIEISQGCMVRPCLKEKKERVEGSKEGEYKSVHGENTGWRGGLVVRSIVCSSVEFGFES